MRRIITSLVAGLIVLGLGPMAAATQQRVRHEMRTDCQFQFVNDAAWTAHEEHLTARCLVRHWSVSGGLAELNSVIACESGWNRWANNGGNYLGLGQHAASAWASRVHTYEPAHWVLKPAWSNSRSNLTVTVRMAHASGWGAWSCA
jgi:hypothetical protein